MCSRCAVRPRRGAVKYFSPNILDGSVTSAKLAASAVTESKIATNAVRARSIQAGAVEQSKLDTSVVTLSGSVGAISHLDIELIAYAFWPMLHAQAANDLRVSGNEVDGASPDEPRLALYNPAGAARTYDLDYRYVG